MNKTIAWSVAWTLAFALTACSGGADREAGQAKAPASGTAAPESAAAFDFSTWVAANAACKGEYFSDMQEPSFPQTLRDAGVGVSDDSGIGEVGPGSGTLTPSKPIRLHGLPVRRIDYDFGSGSTFAVVVEATAEQASAAIQAKPLPEIYREYYKLGVPTAAPSEDVPMPDIQFVRPGEKPG